VLCFAPEPAWIDLSGQDETSDQIIAPHFLRAILRAFSEPGRLVARTLQCLRLGSDCLLQNRTFDCLL
jgi:hypothetical protein